MADEQIPMDRRADIFSRWPGAVTWLLPASTSAPEWITGGNELIAVRVSAHPTVQRICREFGGPLVSTSANLSGQPTPTRLAQVRELLGQHVTVYVDEPLGTNDQPSTIINAITGQVLRS